MLDEFRGTERFAIRRRVGEGAMGVVYEAWDYERQDLVALKMLKRLDPLALYHFKQEFRALTDVTHPNLVALHELYSVGDDWFFTMAFVDGVDWLTYVRGGVGARRGSDAPEAFADTLGDESSLDAAAGTRPVAQARALALPAPAELARLRATLPQLAEGVAALHAAGNLHRDVKPSNVLCAPDGRVTLLDFGLVVARGGHAAAAADGAVVGTPAYMSPEQGAGLELGEASDWYSVGVMLYEALTGRLPFIGNRIEILTDKQRFAPPPPRELVPGLPEDLHELCMELLQRDPAARPSGREVMRRLGVTATSGRWAIGSSLSTSLQQHVLIGRERHLAALEAAFAEARGGGAVIVYVHGGSGMGKSALVQRFLDDVAASDRAVVLQGRCYERESVPYKALDSLVDALSRHLMSLPADAAAALLPRDVAALARLFPVLLRVGAVAEAVPRAATALDPHEVRRAAFTALRALLGALGARKPIVLYIDDLQWGDLDSAVLVEDLLRPPGAPALLLIGSYRSEEAARSPFLCEVREELPGPEVRVEPLVVDDAQKLCLLLLGREDDRARKTAGVIAREARGNPFFLGELVRYVQEGAEDTDSSSPRVVALEQVLAARLRRLPEEARRLLEVVAVAGRPLPQLTALRAAELGPADRTAMAILRAARLVRTAGARDQDAIETYHDQIREAVAGALGAEALTTRHRRLALALSAAPDADPEALALHWRGAGDPAQAAKFAELAARRAAATLAFDRAADLYRVTLELRAAAGLVDAEAERRLRAQRGDALANAGRGNEAAEEYLAACTPGAAAAEILELKRRAAEQLLRSGHIDEGTAAIRGVLQASGMDMAPTPRRALVGLLYRRAQLRLRGLSFHERDSTEISPALLSRIDTCWSVAVGLSVVDTIRGADFQTRHLLLALSAGEPYRVARALAVEAAHSATGGRRTRARTAALLERAEAMAKRLDHPHALGMAAVAGGITGFLEGRYKDGAVMCARAEEILRDRCTGVAWELANARSFGMACSALSGDLPTVVRRVPEFVREAEDRGDLYSAVSYRTGYSNWPWIVLDDVPQATRELAAALRGWSQEGFHVQHYNHMLAAVQLALYEGWGRGDAAWALVKEGWPALEQSLLLRIQQVACDAWFLRARAALAAGRRDDAEADARRVERERMPWAAGIPPLVRAAIAHARGDADGEARLLATAAAAFDAADLPLHAAAARRRRGVLVGGEEGRAAVAAADGALGSRGVVRPARLAAMLAAGFPPEN